MNRRGAAVKAKREYGQYKRDRARKTLREFLSMADDADFLALLWSVDALQSGRENRAKQYITYPKEAATEDISSSFYAYKWDFETLATVLLTSAKKPPKQGRNKHVNCKVWVAAAQAVNDLRDVEEAETALHIDGANIMLEMHRVAQRQFPWQRGYANPQHIYRYLYVYGQGACAEHFEQVHGVSLADFSMIALLLFWQLSENPWIVRPDTTSVGISKDTFNAALKVLGVTLAEGRAEARAMQGKAALSAGGAIARTIYQPCLLRQFPILINPAVGGRLLAPLPQLVLYRATAGLYYDVVRGGTALINDANARFEEYGRLLIRTYLPRFEVQPAHKYPFNGNPVDTPDILAKDGGNIVAVFECKATKLSFDAQFAENPMEAAKGAYDQMTKGIFQLWRFFSHARRGLFSAEPVAADAHGVLLTMETWFAMAKELQAKAMDDARQRAAADPNITDEDMRPIVFCSVSELEDTLGWSDEDTFLTLLARSAEERFRGWSIMSIQRDEKLKAQKVWRKFPFSMEDVMPWWSKIEDPNAKTEKLTA
ncbi:hypothetical protein ELH91_30625 (plasmid) [Rhizobium leguminosarum]|uniref:hypothetical protein n=1 Tax=Rhizobium leguminosarum TaxID=384 RepID=UPI00103262A9|nr:hypothetical protein [Rhizobium leguminosarum]TAY05786.1 hypothetical protein ELH91_30625 [Rhizobium leguminosarum]